MAIREKISQLAIENSLYVIGKKTSERLEEKGWGTLASTHEILGVINEEHAELIEAVKSNNRAAVRDEILDIAVACHFAIACIDSGTLDW
jgi:NTP pyrophosphatase (non-canonical NTP hydrolase)